MNVILKRAQTSSICIFTENSTNWCEESTSFPFSNNTRMSSDTELQAYQWSINVNHADNLHWLKTSVICCNISLVVIQVNGQVLKNLQTSSRLVSDVLVQLKHLVGLSIISQVMDKTRSERLGKGQVRTALLL